MMNILYVGGFLLPDENAAAQRVVNVAKALRDLGHTVYFFNEPKKTVNVGWKQYFDFDCYEQERPKQFAYLTSIDRFKKTIKEKEITAVIAYNHPAIALNKLRKYCKKNNIRCYADATEWYVAQGNPVFRMIKNFDSNYRMKIVHCKLDGVIAISSYLYEFYKNQVETIQIPPLVDIEDKKWSESIDGKDTACCKFVFAGSSGVQKERLDYTIAAIEQTGEKYNVHLDVVGITAQQYETIYGKRYEGDIVKFHGRVSHREALNFVKNADWSIVIRDNNQVVQAGFPTKVPESISAGTPVIANRFSNISDYLDDSNSVLIDDISKLSDAIAKAVDKRISVECSLFDYRKYIDRFRIMFRQENVSR